MLHSAQASTSLFARLDQEDLVGSLDRIFVIAPALCIQSRLCGLDVRTSWLASTLVLGYDPGEFRREIVNH